MKRNLLNWRNREAGHGQSTTPTSETSTSTEQRTDLDLSASKSSTAGKSSILITCLSDLWMATYVTIVTSGDLKHLGGDNDADRREAWANIQDEWEREMLGAKAEIELDHQKEIRKLTFDIARIGMIVDYVQSLGLTEEIKAELAEEGFYLESADEIQQVINQSKQLNIRLDTLIKKTEANAIADNDTAVNKALFVKMCLNFTIQFKVHVVLENIKALDFCVYYRKYCDYIEQASRTPAPAEY